MAVKRFEDEWLVRAAVTISGVTESVVEKYRQSKFTCLAQALTYDTVCSAQDVDKAVESVFRFPPLPAGTQAAEPLALSLVPERVCRSRRMLPFRLTEEGIDLAMANPLDMVAVADAESLSGRKAKAFYCPLPDLDVLLDQNFSEETVIEKLANKISPATDDKDVEVIVEGRKGPSDVEEPARVTAPVIRLVNSLLRQAVLLRASDIHIEQQEHQTDVRFRIDGLLKSVMTVPLHVGRGALVSRIKVMSNLDVANRLRPQDGRGKIRFAEREITLRVSTLPTDHGEKVVIRLLDQNSVGVSLSSLGFGSNNLARLEALMQAGQGMIIVTGPTGSGKTTTLYAMLNHLKSEVTNITTVEDPIEYHLPGINQVQVNEKQGLTFANVLRSVLRQDPDIILVGEIRDAETALVAFQAAMTGHLVFATLHTNDTLSSVTRLTDMGVEPFKIAPSLLAVTAQRLVRRLCPSCRRPIPPRNQNLRVLELLQEHRLPATTFGADGCPACAHTGYAGRLSLMELLVVGRRLRERLSRGADLASLQEAAEQEKSLTPLLLDALWHVSEGHTTAEEIIPFVGLGTPKAAPRTGPSALPTRILVADDDESLRLLLRGILESKGYLVDEAKDGAETLKKMADDPADLLLLDLTMPGLNGHDVIRSLREERGLYQLPIVVVSGDEAEASQEKAFTLGADDYITKPFKPTLVLSRIAAALRRAK